MNETIDLRLRIKCEQDLPLDGDYMEEDMIEVFTGAIVARDRELDTETEVGWGTFYIVRLDVAINVGINGFEACDAMSQDLLEYASAVLDPATGNIREDILEEFECPPFDLLVLHMLEVLPAFRGWNIGLLAAQQVIEYYAKGLVLLRPQPLQFLDPMERREYYDQMEYSRFITPREPARQKLRDHWAQLGFKPIDDGEFLALDATLRRDKVHLRRVGPVGSTA